MLNIFNYRKLFIISKWNKNKSTVAFFGFGIACLCFYISFNRKNIPP